MLLASGAVYWLNNSWAMLTTRRKSVQMRLSGVLHLTLQPMPLLPQGTGFNEVFAFLYCLRMGGCWNLASPVRRWLLHLVEEWLALLKEMLLATVITIFDAHRSVGAGHSPHPLLQWLTGPRGGQMFIPISLSAVFPFSLLYVWAHV